MKKRIRGRRPLPAKLRRSFKLVGLTTMDICDKVRDASDEANISISQWVVDTVVARLRKEKRWP